MVKTTYTYRREVTIGVTAVQVLKNQQLRAEYRIISAPANTDYIYHANNSLVTTSSLDRIPPGGSLVDEGPFGSIHKGEVWLISGTAAQTIEVWEKVRHAYPVTPAEGGAR